jgi:inorganic pyrophosphatase
LKYGDSIDVWIGSNQEKKLTGILWTFDKMKRDAEIKILIGCTLEDVAKIQGFKSGMAMLFIPNPMVEYDLPNQLP